MVVNNPQPTVSISWCFCLDISNIAILTSWQYRTSVRHYYLSRKFLFLYGKFCNFHSFLVRQNTVFTDLLESLTTLAFSATSMVLPGFFLRKESWWLRQTIKQSPYTDRKTAMFLFVRGFLPVFMRAWLEHKMRRYIKLTDLQNW